MQFAAAMQDQAANSLPSSSERSSSSALHVEVKEGEILVSGCGFVSICFSESGDLFAVFSLNFFVERDFLP